MVRLCFSICLLFSALTAFSQTHSAHWVDSVFKTLGRDEKIGQLFVKRITSYQKPADVPALLNEVRLGHVGALLIERSGPLGYARLLNRLQSQAKIPLLVGAGVAGIASTSYDSLQVFYDSAVWLAAGRDSLAHVMQHIRTEQQKLLGIHSAWSSPFDSLSAIRIVALPAITSRKQDVELRKLVSSGGWLLSAPSAEAAIRAIARLMRTDKLLADQVDQTVKRILAAKYAAGLDHAQTLNTDNLMHKLQPREIDWLMQTLAERAVTVLQNNDGTLPVRQLNNGNFASLSLGGDGRHPFANYLSRYTRFTHVDLTSAADTARQYEALRLADVVVVAVFPAARAWLNAVIPSLLEMAKKKTVILCDFGNVSSLRSFENMPAVVATFADAPGLQQAAAEVIFGAIPANGKSPLKISEHWPLGAGVFTPAIGRLCYTVPEAAGVDGNMLEDIAPIAREAIAAGATPGCQVLVARKGKVIYQQAFGWLTYGKNAPVTNETIYDLASVTKVSATLQGVMYLQEQGSIDLNKKASVYLPELKASNKEDFTLKDILTHQAGLWPYLPFWSATVKDSATFRSYYAREASEKFPFPVADHMFASRAMKDSLWRWIIKAKIRENPDRRNYDYRYSDMGFYIMQHLNEKLLRQPQEQFLQSRIYGPLGATTTGYLPLQRFDATQIAPTEDDTLFRKRLLVGYVHDQGAAMHGGIAGHAGLFSNANDLAKLGQMWLNQGAYGGIRYFKPETLALFTARQYEDSRRGLGWDKPVLNDASSPTTWFASAQTFGHTGFTGTCIWVDPAFDLVYIFLSNRVHPDMNNTRLLNANIRPRIQEVIYKAIFEYCKNHAPVETN